MSLNLQTTNVFARHIHYYDELKKAGHAKPIIIHEGGGRCFHKGQKVCTPSGSIEISKLSKGDEVISFDGKKDVIRKVDDCFKNKNTKKAYRIKLKNGQIIQATEDHEFYFKGGWYKLKEIVSLFHGKMESNTQL